MADANLTINIKTNPKDPFEDLSKGLNQAKNAASDFGSSITKIGLAFAGFSALKGTFDFVLNATKQMEDLTSQFVRFTGSTEEARKHLEALQNIPGPSLDEISQADKALLNFGVSADKTAEELRQLNEVAITTGAKIGDLAEIFGKIQEDGNLTAETFSKLSKQMPGFATDFSQALGISKQEFKELAKEGKITASEILSALNKITSEGGKAFGAAAKNASTLTGSFSALSDALTNIAGKFGEGFSPVMAKAANSMAEFINKIASARGSIQTVVDDAALSKISELNDKIKDLTKSMDEAKKKSKDPLRPWEWKQDDLKDVEKLEKRIAGLKRAREQIEKIASDKGFQATKEKIDTRAQDDLDKAEADRLEKKRIKDKEAADEAKKLADEHKAKIAAVEKEITTIQAQEQAVRALQAQTAAAGGTEIAVQVLTDREAALTQARVDAEIQRAELLSQYDEAEKIRAKQKEDVLTATAKKGEADRIAAIRKAQADEFNLFVATKEAQKNFDEQTYAQRVQTANKGLNALISLQSNKSHEAFEIGKAAALVQAAVSIPLTAIEAYKSLAGIPIVGPSLGAAAAAAAVISGTDQLRKIQAQRFAEGGLVNGPPGTDNIPALMTKGETVVPEKNFDQLADSWVAGAVASDQIILTRQTNDILGRILETLNFGSVSEKLTTVIAALQRINLSQNDSGRNPYSDAKATNNEIARNQPQGGFSPSQISMPGTPQDFEKVRAPVRQNI